MLQKKTFAQTPWMWSCLQLRVGQAPYLTEQGWVKVFMGEEEQASSCSSGEEEDQPMYKAVTGRCLLSLQERSSMDRDPLQCLE